MFFMIRYPLAIDGLLDEALNRILADENSSRNNFHDSALRVEERRCGVKRIGKLFLDVFYVPLAYFTQNFAHGLRPTSI